MALPLSEPRGKEDPSPSMCLNAWTEPAANFNRGIRNRQLTLVIAGQESNPRSDENYLSTLSNTILVEVMLPSLSQRFP